MTAEIAILNKTAVALAADSKVTLSRGGMQKTYDTVDKLFSLSKTEPVGAMIYGNAEFIGFPWETVIKEYRRKRAGQTFDTVFDWADDLKSFLLAVFPFSDEDEDRVAISIAQSWIQETMQQVMPGSRGPDDFRLALIEAAEIEIEELEAADDFLTQAEWTNLKGRIKKRLQSLSSSGFFAQFPDCHAPLLKIAELGIRKAVASPATSGLVVAGFGECELLPSLISFDVDGILTGRLKALPTQRIDTTRKSTGVILPFAQTDMVYRFMQGIDPDYAVLIHEGIGDLLLENALDTARALGHSDEEIEKLMPALTTATQASVRAFWDENEKLRSERFASPIIEMAMSLPKDELANLAESLVSLTSLQRRVSREIETVGGAIDVAVISKGDGFVWIKRKHYFNPDRNLRFVNAYFSELGRVTNGGKHSGDNATA
ncbi:hypothetical protein QBK99_05225 [Corticibacterium sp. UT-5YL-CI-8]|nr:hypothetical protein [Tianweitania sp. UT-5YL-CI-8]